MEHTRVYLSAIHLTAYIPFALVDSNPTWSTWKSAKLEKIVKINRIYLSRQSNVCRAPPPLPIAGPGRVYRKTKGGRGSFELLKGSRYAPRASLQPADSYPRDTFTSSELKPQSLEEKSAERDARTRRTRNALGLLGE